MAQALRRQNQEAAFDVVGRYNQDQINGFDPSLIERMLEIIAPFDGARIIELMGGDGNLTSRLMRYCTLHQIFPQEVKMLEYSRVQSEFAAMELAESIAEVIWGDVLTMHSLDSNVRVPEKNYDRVFIKSSNHEIPLSKQPTLYKNAFELLRPGGTFINLGMLFENNEERDELGAIGRAKDSLAGMNDAVKNRHWLTREELYGFLSSAGFVDIRSSAEFDYSIASRIVSHNYFEGKKRDQFDLEFQAAQVRARTMRRNGRITFDNDSSLMRCPGEITTARRQTVAEVNSRLFNQYPYDFVRKIAAHRELIDQVEQAIPAAASVLDLGCGIGLLAERLVGRIQRYEGIDLSRDFVQICQKRLQNSGFSFSEGDINTLRLKQNSYDVITLLNVIYIEGVEPLHALERAFDALTPGGKLFVSGPTHARSFADAESKILEQLHNDRLLAGNEAILQGIKQANASLLTERAHYWSAEGMSALLREIGFTVKVVSTHHYYGNAYLIIAEK